MYKSNTELIAIDAKATEPIPTNVVFWSHDKGTAKMIFELQKNHVDQSLATGTKVPILLEFDSATAENGRGKHTYFATIDDAVNGIVSIVLEDNILGYQGRVDGSIYIELPDSRSLDTAGRFTFHIKRSPIDEDVPELENYYWQGFGEIMEQYHESIAEIKSEAKTTLDSLTADVTAAQNKVTQLEQSITTANTNLNTRIDEINKKIDDNDVFTKAESSANVIYQVIGKEKVRITYVLDFLNKVQGSLVENLNKAEGFSGSVSPTPDQSGWGEILQNNYDKFSKSDNNLYVTGTNIAENKRYLKSTYDILGFLKNELGKDFFIDRGATDLASQVNLVRNIIVGLSGNVLGYGSSSVGNKLTLSSRQEVNDSAWKYVVSSNTGSTSKLTSKINPTSIYAYIDNSGKYTNLINAEQSNGTVASTLNLDYAFAEVTIEISMNEHIKSMMAQNHVTNLATTDEAKAGTNTTKTMTPATTAQAIDNRAVTLASNQTIGGIKNFKDGLMVGGDLAVSKNDHSVFILDASNCDKIIDGAATFIKHGALVIALGAFKFKTAVAFGTVISSALPAELSATIVNGIVTGNGSNDTAKAMYSEKGTTNLRANSNFVINEWFTFGGVYWTGKDK